MIINEYKMLLDRKLDLQQELTKLKYILQTTKADIQIAEGRLQRTDTFITKLQPEKDRIGLILLIDFCNTPTWRYKND